MAKSSIAEACWPQIYDVALDETRPVTQQDIDKLMLMAQAFGQIKNLTFMIESFLQKKKVNVAVCQKLCADINKIRRDLIDKMNTV